jgi:membrane complex biogenesis BtpA family protein
MDIFPVKNPIIGMIHLLPLPGAPRYTDIQEVMHQAQKDYTALREGGVDSILIENFGDNPYLKDAVEPQTITWMTRIILSLKIDIPFGVNVLRNDCKAALAIAHATGGQFVRCNMLTGAMVCDQGIIEGKASKILRYRKMLQTDICIFADIQVKHASPLADQPLDIVAQDTVSRGLADALVVTGSQTGEQPSLKELAAVKKRVPHAFLCAGSGVNTRNVEFILEYADGCIVGESFKKEGIIENPVDMKRVREFMKKVEGLREDL